MIAIHHLSSCWYSSLQTIRTHAKKLSRCEIASLRTFHVTHLTHCCTEGLLYKVQVLCLVGCAEEIRAWCVTKIMFSGLHRKSRKKGHCPSPQLKAGCIQQLAALKEVNCPVWGHEETWFATGGSQHWRYKNHCIARQLKPSKTCLPVYSLFLRFFWYEEIFFSPHFNDNSEALSNNDHCKRKSKVRAKQCLKLFSKTNSSEATITYNSQLGADSSILNAANTSSSTLSSHRRSDRKELSKAAALCITCRQHRPDLYVSSSPCFIYMDGLQRVYNTFRSQRSKQCHFSCPSYLLHVHL